MISQFLLMTALVCVVICLSQVRVEHQLKTSNDTRLPESNISKSNNRTKRFLIFQGNGVLKLVVGFSQPLDLMDKHPYRQLSVSYSIHMQYTPPTVPAYWWTYFVNNPAWAHARSNSKQSNPKKHKQRYHHNPHLKHYGTFVQRPYLQPAIVYDVSRFLIYKAIESIFKSKGLPGEGCLLRTICDISQRPLNENNAAHGIINAIFSPTMHNIDKKYLRAKQIGVHGLNCERIYWTCSKGMKWLEQVSHYI